MAKAKVILIDPIAKKVTITMIESSPSSTGENYLPSIKQLLQCDRITGAGDVTPTDTIYADDEALNKNYFNEAGEDIDAPAFYCEAWYPGPIVGRAIIVGVDAEGKTKSVSDAAVKELYARNKANQLHWAVVDLANQEFRLLK